MSAKVALARSVPVGTVIYEYGCRVDRSCIPAIDEQVRSARKLYNDIVETMRRAWDEAQALVMARAGEPAAALALQIETATERFQAARAANDSAAMEKIARERRQLRSQLFPILAEVRRAEKSRLKAVYACIGNNSGCETYQLVRKAVADGLGWATGGAILDAALKAWSASVVRGHAPRFARGESRTQDSLTLRFVAAGGMPLEKLFSAGSADLRLSVPEPGKRRYGSFEFRLGRAAHKAYATGTLQYHRRLPDSARVGLARLMRKRVGKDIRYALQLQLNLPQPYKVSVPAGRANLVCIHFGWSADAAGRRVAGVADSAEPSCGWLLQLPAWRAADRLRWQDASHIARTARNRRRGHWREVAIDLARRYAAIAIEPLDLREAALTVDADTGERAPFNAQARSGRVVAGVGELESALRWACIKTHTPLIEIEGHDTATACAHCGGATVHERDSYQTLHCTACHAEIDRKINGAARAWQLAQPQLSRLADEFAAFSEHAWEKAQAAKQQKTQKMLAARGKFRQAG